VPTSVAQLSATLSPSTSLACVVSVTGAAASSTGPAGASSTTGASLTGATVMRTVAVREFMKPSFARNVNESLPLKSCAGV
jgi:hypothetical protein